MAPTTQPSIDDAAAKGAASTSTLRPVATVVALIVFAAAALWVSYHQFRWQWSLDGDIAGPHLVWQQVLRDGPQALMQWRYAQDNWLLSLTLPDFVLLGLTGDSPWMLLHQGWIFFLANALLTYAILQFVAPRPIAAATALAMLFAGPAVIGGAIYLGYPVTHSISLVWGLGALSLFLLWLRSERLIWLGLGGLALFIGDVSDPWLAPALVLPIALAAAIAAATTRIARWRLAALALCALVVFGLARTRLGGFMWFLPGSDFTLGPWDAWAPHLGWIATYASIMYNAVPAPQPGSEWAAPVWLIAVNCALLALIVGWSILRLLSGWNSLGVEARFLAATAVIGGAATLAAFTISNVNATMNVGRYISNWFYFVPLVVVIAAFGAPRAQADWLRRFAATWCALLIAAGVAAAPANLRSLPADIAKPETRDLIRFLDDNGLTYGYAPFWATDGAVAEWLSGERIIIRPVSRSSSDHIIPRVAQTFPSWFESQDIPSGQKRFFFIAAPDKELCPDTASCEALARREFGPPLAVLNFHDIPIMVWDHPIMTGLPDADLIAEAPVLEPDASIRFTPEGAGGALEGRGWSGVEERAAWTEAREAVLKIHLPDDWIGPATLEFVAAAYATPAKRTAQAITVKADGRALATWTVAPWELKTYSAALPADIAEQKRIALVFEVPGAIRPSDLLYVLDTRLLGLGLASVTLRR